MQRRWLEVRRIEALGIHHRAWHVAKNHEFLSRQAQVVAVGRTAETQNRPGPQLWIQMSNQPLLEGFEHALGGLFADPAIVLQHQKPRRNWVT